MAAVDPKKLVEHYGRLNEVLKEQAKSLSGLRSEDERRANVAEQITNHQKVINELTKIQLTTKQDVTAELINEEAEKKKLIDQEKQFNTQLEKGVYWRKEGLDLARKLGGEMKNIWSFLNKNDKVIRSTNLQLGLSGTKAAVMRNSINDSAGLAIELGGSYEDVAAIMQGFSEETGRARALTGSMSNDILLIGKGTGLGIEGATKLGAQFELMGIDTRATMEYVEGVVDTSERMGVNTTKVLKGVSDNFKKLQNMTFQQGVRGYAQMASYAEKMKIDMGQALDSAQASRSLEHAIDLAAQLQVMGGEFAKTDPFELLYLSRNDPAKYAEKINEMTKGIVTLKKSMDSEGKTTFEKFISPADRDRLEAVGKALGLQTGEMTQQALRMKDIQKARQQMAGMGLDKREKQLIEGAMIMSTKTGRMQVDLAGTMTDISKLTTTQAKSFASEQVLLKDRAKAAMTFEETFKKTIEILKATLLPMLETFNNIFLPKLQKISDRFVKWSTQSGGWIKAFGALLTAAITMKAAGMLMNAGLSKVGSAGGNLFSGKGSTSSPTTPASSGARAAGDAGKGMLRGGVGVGAAALGVGAGIGLAAGGISELADSMSKLDEKQAEVLKSIVLTLGLSIGVTTLAAAGLMVLGTGAAAAAGPLLAFGAAVLMVGAGIGVAALGIGKMGEGLGTMFESSKDAGDDMLKIGAGVGFMATSLLGATVALPTAIGLSMVLRRIGKNAPALATVGDSIQKIKAGLSGSREDYEAIAEAIKTISNVKLKRNNAISQMAEMMNKPLKVEFDRSKVNLVNDITLNIDGDKFMRKTYRTQIAVNALHSIGIGKGENNGIAT